jgi:DNA-binding MarR family transcriptional regulator
MRSHGAPVEGLVAAVTRMSDAVRRGQAEVFDPVRVGVLRLVVERGPLRPGAVAEELDVLASSVTRHVRVLVGHGHLTMTADPTDRRAVLIAATEAGREQYRQFREIGTEVFGAVVEDWTDRDIVGLTTLLDRLFADWSAKGAEQQRRAAGHRRRFAWSEA